MRKEDSWLSGKPLECKAARVTKSSQSFFVSLLTPHVETNLLLYRRSGSSGLREDELEVFMNNQKSSK